MFKKRAIPSIIKTILTRNNPFFVQFAVNKRCNTRCRMCRVSEFFRGQRELTLSEIERVAENLKRIGNGIIFLVGGEPFQRDDLPLVVRVFTNKGFTVRIVTNGVGITKERLTQVIEAGCNNITVSLHSLSPQIQDYICNYPGAWYEIIKTLASLSTLSTKKDGYLKIGTVVSKHNLKELPSLVKFATRVGFYIDLIPVHFPYNRGEYFDSGENISQWKFEPKDYELIDKVFTELIRMRQEGFYIFNTPRFLKESIDFFKYGRADWKIEYQYCGSPEIFFFITVDGRFAICNEKPLRGDEPSLLDSNFPKIYKNRDFRKKIRQQTRTCQGCMASCWTETSMLFKDWRIFLDRCNYHLSFQLRKNRIKAVGYDEMLQIIDEIRSNESIIS